VQQAYWNNGFLNYWELIFVIGGVNFGTNLLCAVSLLKQRFPELLGAYLCHLVVKFGTILLCAASLLEQRFSELLEVYFCHLVVNFGTILLCAASLLEQCFPELLGVYFCHLVVNFGTILSCVQQAYWKTAFLNYWEFIFAIWR
jgi:hypothetical protein